MHSWEQLRSIVIVFTPAADWQMTLSFCCLFEEHPPVGNACDTLKRPNAYVMVCSCFVCISPAVTSDLLHSTCRCDRFITTVWITGINPWESVPQILLTAHSSAFQLHTTESTREWGLTKGTGLFWCTQFQPHTLCYDPHCHWGAVESLEWKVPHLLATLAELILY